MGIFSKIGIEMAPKQPVNPTVPNAPVAGVPPSTPVLETFQNAFNSASKETLNPTKTPMPDAVKTTFPENTPPGALDPTIPASPTPETIISSKIPTLGPEQASQPASLLDPVPQPPAQPVVNPSNLENTLRPLDTLIPPPTTNIVAEEPRISSIVDEAPQNTVFTPQSEPEIVSAPTIPEPITPQEPVVKTVTSPEPVFTVSDEVTAASSSENKGTNDVSQNKEQEVSKPINFLERYLLKHHLKNYVTEDGSIDEESLSHDAQSPDKLQEIDPRVANLVKGLTDRGLSLDDPLIAAGVEEVYMEDQKKAA